MRLDKSDNLPARSSVMLLLALPSAEKLVATFPLLYCKIAVLCGKIVKEKAPIIIFLVLQLYIRYLCLCFATRKREHSLLSPPDSLVLSSRFAELLVAAGQELTHSHKLAPLSLQYSCVLPFRVVYGLASLFPGGEHLRDRFDITSQIPTQRRALSVITFIA